MADDITFHFVTEGIEAALDRARAAAGGKAVRLGGGGGCSTASATHSTAGRAWSSRLPTRWPMSGCAVFDTMGA
jgi:hypothetical protein